MKETIVMHPATLDSQYRKMLVILSSFAILQNAWAIAIFLFSAYSPDTVEAIVGFEQTAGRFYQPGIVYSMYSLAIGFYILLCSFLSYFLASKTWIMVGSIFAMIPGPGIFFGVLQIIPAFQVFWRLRSKEWNLFFEWHRRTKSVKDLTPGSQ